MRNKISISFSGKKIKEHLKSQSQKRKHPFLKMVDGKKVNKKSVIIISKKDKVIIRILWGNATSSIKRDGSSFSRVIKEDRNGCSDTVNEKSVSVAVGQDNYDFLKENGAKNLVLFSKKDFIQPEGYPPWWHKTYIVKKFLEEYKEVCFLDWDNFY